jgi:DeoR family transcriptional regulator, fructose operon transcriptional repressor
MQISSIKTIEIFMSTVYDVLQTLGLRGGSGMYPFEREEIILEACRASGRITSKDLIKMTGCSISTLRRDIDALFQRGAVKKIRGGISIIEQPEMKGGLLYEQRLRQNYLEKEAIGRAAQEFIHEGDILVLLYGTTTIHVARQIDPNKHLTVITNGLDIVHECRKKPNLRVIVLGGSIDYSNNCIKGPTVPNMLKEFNTSKVILGAGGITEEKGVTNYEFLNTTYVSDIVDLCGQNIIVADHSKFGRNVLTKVMPFKRIDVLITDAKVPESYIPKFKEYGIEYRIVQL